MAVDKPLPAWGKFDEVTRRIHLLECHCADVAACFEALLEDPVLESRVKAACGSHPWNEVTKARLTYLAYLHDFGKVNRRFQFKVPRLPGRAPIRGRHKGHIRLALACCDNEQMLDALGFKHTLGTWGSAAVPLLLAALSHHGRPAQRPNGLGSVQHELCRPDESYDPIESARRLIESGQQWFPLAFSSGPDLPTEPALAHLFAGLVALADQIGSDEELFEYEDVRDPGYIVRARKRAFEAVSKRGFSRQSWTVGTPIASVQSLFGYEVARPSQQAISEASLKYPLQVLESETGSGKTEAAILRFAHLWRAGLVDGLYFALPTRAAAKQLHTRVSAAMERLIPIRANVETVLAVPGYIRAGKSTGRRYEKFKVFWEDRPDEAKRQSRWAAESSRTYLSSTTAVGTVDQVLLAGLRVKWAHLRAASMVRSLLVVDEVHASDAYMSELLASVLRAHLALGGHALVMSATLGSKARQKIVSRDLTLMKCDAASDYPYPVLTMAKPGEETCVTPIKSQAKPKSVTLSICEHVSNPGQIAARAIKAARSGAKVLVIRNTVSGCRAVFEAMGAHGDIPLLLTVNGVPTAHHSRFAVEDRRLLDSEVERVLGKNAENGTGIVVLGTQTLEQSLDLDADFLITDLCPADVLLQRIGRLHRHDRERRPLGYSSPCCLVLAPEGGLLGAVQGRYLRHGLGLAKSGGVYPNCVELEATRRLIIERPTWIIPDNCRQLVESATHPERLNELAEELGEEWCSHLQEVDGRFAAHSVIARLHALTRKEEFDEYLTFPDIDQDVRSRLGEDGPRVILSEPTIGPFAKLVRTFNIPAHLFRGELPDAAEIEAAEMSRTDSRILELKIGNHRFSYGPDGLHRLATSAQ